MNANVIVLQNAKAQLEAQKQSEYDNAYASKYAELKSQEDAFVAQKQAECDAAIQKLTAAYNEAVEEKKKHCDEAIATQKATIRATAAQYAGTRAANTDKLIAEIDKLIAAVTEA